MGYSVRVKCNEANSCSVLKWLWYTDCNMKARLWHKGFTIVELVIVVVVVGIIAAITVVSYNGILGQNREKALEGDLYKAATQLHDMKMRDGSFPATANDFSVSNGDTTLIYSRSGDGFCVGGSNSKLPGVTMYVTDGKKVTKGECPVLYVQAVTTANCPEVRTMAADARDGRTYWIQKMLDNRCWMLTNLAYSGGGTNTYGDVKPLQNGNADSALTYIEPKYYIHSSANPTASLAQPSISTDGGVTNPQYGYHYNWCAVMGGQMHTSACNGASTPLPDPATSICPAGWRLPTGGLSGEYQTLSTAIGANNSSAGSQSLRNSLLTQMGGMWNVGFVNLGSYGFYWSATQNSAATTTAHYFYFSNTAVSSTAYNNKNYGVSVRCIAN